MYSQPPAPGQGAPPTGTSMSVAPFAPGYPPGMAPPQACTLPNITIEKGQSVYVHLTYNSCACGTDMAEMFVGTREKHDKLIATAELPNPLCNYLCRGFGICSCCCYTEIPVKDPAGKLIGNIQLGRHWRCCCCLPQLDVWLGNTPVGKLWTRCCCCNTCKKEIDRNGTTTYASQKCIKSKVLNCFLPGCYSIYRMFFKNRTTVEYYTMAANSSEPSFEIINVRITRC